ncbi:energy transducer TonB [Cupriavidus sp. AU9028]|uniref:energy transducer TonB n=1 Tax=Cupriavidus sp. AU9028 TaxID=2871157 RepID=UPI001C93B091|nr:energy transducer TonB [Cupriavidus sp. AU9028]MBY4896314.1 TonB family protein [Cupriavidus sp. AU9028]
MFDQRLLKITLAVLLFHAGLLYLIQSGLGRKLTEAVVAPEIVARIIPLEPPQQAAPEPPKPQPKKEPPPPKEVKVTKPRPEPKPQPKREPLPEPVPDLPPSPAAVEVPPAPPAPPEPPAPPPEPAPPVATGPRSVSIGEIQCSTPQPTYPSQSRRMGETGKTVVRLTTDESGRVVRTAVVSSSGSSRLDQAAMDAVQRMRCKPYMENGRALAITAQQPVNFELN